MDSILTSIKKMLGIEETYEHFDQELIISINAILMVLQQIGVGPEEGYFIAGKEESWNILLGQYSGSVEAVKAYVYLKVRLLFDPPSNSFLIEAIERQIKEFEWRIRHEVETEKGGDLSG